MNGKILSRKRLSQICESHVKTDILPINAILLNISDKCKTFFKILNKFRISLLFDALICAFNNVYQTCTLLYWNIFLQHKSSLKKLLNVNFFVDIEQN